MTAPPCSSVDDTSDDDASLSSLSQPTAQEIAWAKSIRQAVQKHPDLDESSITDWEYLAHAMVAKDKVNKALARIQKIQAFKKRYGIQGDGSTADARRDLEICFQIHPGFFCAVSTLDNRKHDATRPFPQLICYQYRCFNGQSFVSEEAHAIFMRGAFYMCHACMPHVGALRSGTFLLADCRGFSLRTFNIRAELCTSELLMDAYPMRIYRISLLYVSVFFRFVYTLARSLLSAKMQRVAILVGKGQAAQDYLDSLQVPESSLPAKWGGTFRQEDMYDTLIRRLEERFANADAFRL